MKKYRVRAVYSGCDYGEAVAETHEQALEEERRLTDMFIEDFGEKNYMNGIGDFCVYIDEIDA